MKNRISAERTYPDRLRHDIDSGRTGDKVAASDPAAAPLGTDEEAAGTPVSGHAVDMARRMETGRPGTPRPPSPHGHAWIGAAALLVLGTITICLLLLL